MQVCLNHVYTKVHFCSDFIDQIISSNKAQPNMEDNTLTLNWLYSFIPFRYISRNAEKSARCCLEKWLLSLIKCMLSSVAEKAPRDCVWACWAVISEIICVNHIQSLESHLKNKRRPFSLRHLFSTSTEISHSTINNEAAARQWMRVIVSLLLISTQKEKAEFPLFSRRVFSRVDCG